MTTLLPSLPESLKNIYYQYVGGLFREGISSEHLQKVLQELHRLIDPQLTFSNKEQVLLDILKGNLESSDVVKACTNVKNVVEAAIQSNLTSANKRPWKYGGAAYYRHVITALRFTLIQPALYAVGYIMSIIPCALGSIVGVPCTAWNLYLNSIGYMTPAQKEEERKRQRHEAIFRHNDNAMALDHDPYYGGATHRTTSILALHKSEPPKGGKGIPRDRPVSTGVKKSFLIDGKTVTRMIHERPNARRTKVVLYDKVWHLLSSLKPAK